MASDTCSTRASSESSKASVGSDEPGTREAIPRELRILGARFRLCGEEFVEGAQIGGRQVKTGLDMYCWPGAQVAGHLSALCQRRAYRRQASCAILAQHLSNLWWCGCASGSTTMLDDWSILSRSGRAPGGGSCGGSSYQDIRTRRMNGKNHERRSLEDIVVVSYYRSFAHSFPKMDGDARSESPVSDLPVSSGKGLGECSCVPVSPVLHRT